MRLVWLVIPLVLIGIFVVHESFAQEENSSTIHSGNLEFSLITDKKYYHDNETIHILWQVHNTGNDDVSYMTSSTCDDGFDLSIMDSNGDKVNGILGNSAKLINENDSTVLKFESSGFYGNILQSIQDTPDKTRDILIFTSNGDRLVNILKEKFEVVKHSESKPEPDAIGARVSVKHIPEIARLDLVTNILEGDAPVCGSAMLTKVLEPNNIMKGNFSWSQLVHVKDSLPQHMSDGNYSIIVKFNEIQNCVVVAINVDDSQNDKISCFDSNVITENDLPSVPPLKQITLGISHNTITCNVYLELIFKSSDNSPACVKPITAEKLIERGWATYYATKAYLDDGKIVSNSIHHWQQIIKFELQRQNIEYAEPEGYGDRRITDDQPLTPFKLCATLIDENGDEFYPNFIVTHYDPIITEKVIFSKIHPDDCEKEFYSLG